MLHRATIVSMLVLGPALGMAARRHASPRPTTTRANAAPQHAPAATTRHAAERTVWDSVYSAEQATRGQASYNQTCARCHQASLGGADDSPALTGSGFLGNWNGLTLADLQERVKTTMPNDDPGSYGRQLITDVMAYVLKMNGFPAGAKELPAEPDALKAIRIAPKP